MSKAKAKQLKARVMFCWICSKKLCMGGRTYAEVYDEQNVMHPCHWICAQSDKPNPTAQPKEKLP